MTETYRFDQYLNRKQAAKFLGVSIHTLKSWEKKRVTGFKVGFHPVTNWPLYKKEDLEKLLRNISQERK